MFLVLSWNKGKIDVFPWRVLYFVKVEHACWVHFCFSIFYSRFLGKIYYPPSMFHRYFDDVISSIIIIAIILCFFFFFFSFPLFPFRRILLKIKMENKDRNFRPPVCNALSSTYFLFCSLLICLTLHVSHLRFDSRIRYIVLGPGESCWMLILINSKGILVVWVAIVN